MNRVIAFSSGIVAGVALLVAVLVGFPPAFASPHAGKSRIQASQSGGETRGAQMAQPDDPDSDFPPPSALSGDDTDDGAMLDLQGDEVTPAVARYRFDSQGNIYETHAPHTEVPKLGSPVM